MESANIFVLGLDKNLTTTRHVPHSGGYRFLPPGRHLHPGVSRRGRAICSSADGEEELQRGYDDCVAGPDFRFDDEEDM